MINKLINSIQEINVPSNIKDKEIDAKKHAKEKNVPLEAKLPFVKESPTPKKKKHRRHKKKGENYSGRGSSDESSSGNESGNEEFGTVERTEG